MKTSVSAWIAVFLCIPAIARAEYVLDLGTPITNWSYCQETPDWCGAAAAQMILQYSSPVADLYAQKKVWQTIQSYKVEPVWFTDPAGLRGTLEELGLDRSIEWVVASNSDALTLMRDITHWMAKTGFPTAVVVNRANHWVVIEGFTADADPTTTDTILVKSLDIIDPSKLPCLTAADGGSRRTIGADVWYAAYWFSPVDQAGSEWEGRYVAVVPDPPQRKGSVNAPPRQQEEGELISPAAAQDFARQWLAKFTQTKPSRYSVLQDSHLLEPMLVNPDQGGYYIVPLGDKDGGVCQGVILVNAYTGEFQEIGVFQQPRKYLAEKDAIARARQYLGADVMENEAQSARGSLVFEPSEQTESRLYPLWRITIGTRSVFISQDGAVYDTITKPRPGGG